MFPCLLPPNAVSISVGANRDTLGLLPRDGGCAALCCDRGGGPVHVCVSVHHRKTRPFSPSRVLFLGQMKSNGVGLSGACRNSSPHFMLGLALLFSFASRERRGR